MAFDVYQAVTDKIIAELEKGIIPWNKPWSNVGACAVSRATGKPYSVLNQMLLSKAGEYLTFKQVHDEGGKVKKGAKASMVVFWKMVLPAKTDNTVKPIIGADEKAVMKSLPILKYFNVFHISDCEGIEPRVRNSSLSDNESERIKTAKAVLHDYIEREHIGFTDVESDNAYYRPATDEIVIPNISQFDKPVGYYGTAFHEAVHSTGHKSRLNRLESGINAAFGSQVYSKEELVAEIGSAAIMSELGLQTDATLTNSAAYIQSWLKPLKNDKRFIVSAASRAEKAVKLILNR